MTDHEQPEADDQVPAIAPEDPHQSEPNPNEQTSKEEFQGRINRIVTRFKHRPSFLWSAAINAFVAVVVTIGTVVAVLSLLSLNRSVAEMVKQTPEIAKSALAAKDAADAAKAAAVAAQSSAKASESQASAALAQANAATRANELTEAGQRENVAAFRTEQRARLTYSFTFMEPADTGEFQFIMPVQNPSPTEATKVRFGAVVMSMKTGHPILSGADWSKVAWNDVAVISSREQNRQLRIEGLLPTTDLAEYRRKERHIGIIVRLEYCDIFQRRHHMTRCAERFLGQTKGSVNYCGVETDTNEGELSQPECRP